LKQTELTGLAAAVRARKGRKPPKKYPPELMAVPPAAELARALVDVAGDFGLGELVDFLGLDPARAAEIEDLCDRLRALGRAGLLKLEDREEDG